MSTVPKSPYPDGDRSILACPSCGSGEYLWNEDGNRNHFCGQCGQAIAQGRRGVGVEELTAIPQSDYIYHIRPVRHHNRQLHKAAILPGGIRKSNQAPRYVRGFRLFDKVSYLGEDCFIWGRRSSGSFLLKLLDGTKVKDGVGYKRISLLERSASYLIS